jgi:hypothetical protein
MDSRNDGPVLAGFLSNPAISTPQCGYRADCSNLSALPAGFPNRLDHDLAWNGAQFRDEARIIYHLTESDLEEVRNALFEFKAMELDGDLVSTDNFVLPSLGPKIERQKRELFNGTGLCVIRGINHEEYSVEDLTTVWLGIQAHLADRRGCQDDQGNMLVHIVADDSSELKHGHHRHSTSAISFHNEGCGDVVGWLTRTTASVGGQCIVSSAYTIYNVLAVHRPDIIRTLARADWPFALPRFQCRPLIFYHGSRLIMNFGRTALLGSAVHPRPEHLPKLSDRQREALDVVEAIAQAVQLEIRTQAGDMHFINNFAVLHRREGYVNGSAPGERRHLVRMLLRDSSLGWSLPVDLKPDWDEAFEKDVCKAWHLEPMPGNAFPLRKYPN